MHITSAIVKDATGLSLPDDIAFDAMGWANTNHNNALSFIDDAKYVSQLNSNSNVKGVIAINTLSSLLRTDLIIIESTDPRADYYTLFNFLAKSSYTRQPSVIAPDAFIHPTAHVDSYNVHIASGCAIGPNVSILAGAELGRNCVIQAGAVIGSEGFEYKRTNKGILPVFHDGKAILGDNVEIGANTCIDKGFADRHTIIGESTKIDNLVHIGHNAHIGKRCLIAACAQIGAVDMDDDVWVGPSANLLTGQKIGAHAYITVGSVVTKDVASNGRVTGNFAIPHDRFMENLKKSIA